MSSPKGKLVTPVGFRSDGSVHALELDNSDRLKVLLDAITAAIQVTQTTPANLTIASHGFVNSAWHKDPLRFGYSGNILEHVGSTTLAAGTNNFDTTAVPANKVHVITQMSMIYTGTAPTRIAASHSGLGTTRLFFAQLAPVSTGVYDRQGYWVLTPGDFVRFQVTGATLNDDFFGFISGFVVDINL